MKNWARKSWPFRQSQKILVGFPVLSEFNVNPFDGGGVVMEKREINGVTWHRCDYLSNGTRRWYHFRMIGRYLYCTPRNLERS